MDQNVAPQTSCLLALPPSGCDDIEIACFAASDLSKKQVSDYAMVAFGCCYVKRYWLCGPYAKVRTLQHLCCKWCTLGQKNFDCRSETVLRRCVRSYCGLDWPLGWKGVLWACDPEIGCITNLESSCSNKLVVAETKHSAASGSYDLNSRFSSREVLKPPTHTSCFPKTIV